MRRKEPDFENILRVLARKKTEHPVLFELFLNMPYYERLSGTPLADGADELAVLRKTMEGYLAAGYDYCTTHASGFHFYPDALGPHAVKKSRSLNDRAAFTDLDSYEAYRWPEVRDYDSGSLAGIRPYLPEGMKLLVMGPGGILENMIDLLGYDNLCMLLYDEPKLVREVADQIGKRLLDYYKEALQYDTVGFLCYNDDWGFNTQTLLSPADLRSYVFPWVKRIVSLAHAYGKPCILHSCGYFQDIIEDVIGDMGFDARHSYEDNIMPVEEAYEKYGSRIAILGGIDVDFICRKTPEDVYRRSREMLERTMDRGGYALGTGNSVPEYVPYENYLAMLRAAWEA